MDEAIRERAAGVVLGMAAGDALGAGYEFGGRLPDDVPAAMIGGGLGDFEPGEWTDDTAMAVPLLEVAARGGRFIEEDLDEVVGRWLEWSGTAKDIGTQTRAVLHDARSAGTAHAAWRAAREHHRRTGRSGGNGSLMRTAPLALALLDDEDELVAAVRRVSELTHADPDAGTACVLWCVAIRRAVLSGEVDVRAGLVHVRQPRRDVWSRWLDEAERLQPSGFPHNSWVVEALQGAWSAIAHGNDLADVLQRAVHGGGDTDTVAAIAGALAGARDGAGAVPEEWRRVLHGWPGSTGEDLASLARRAARSVDRVAPHGGRALLEAVRILHGRGYELLRVHPTFSAAGHWRCTLFAGDATPGGPVLRYSSGAGWDHLGDGADAPVPSSVLADRLIARLPALEGCCRPDPGYRFWYAALLERCSPDRAPFLAEDWSWPEREGRVGISGSGDGGLLGDSFPLPPSPPIAGAGR